MTKQSDHPDSVAQLLRVLSQQGILLGQHNTCLQSLEQQQASTNAAVVEISRNIQAIQNQLFDVSPSQPTASPLAACPNPVVNLVMYQRISPPPPEPFSGDLEKSRVFFVAVYSGVSANQRFLSGRHQPQFLHHWPTTRTGIKVGRSIY
ncbi:hypothetical protein ATANTOWER_025659 [Ataeniobius toweri]|uniref:Uncharacterized protein n=1 Tax=Ataeniobius toweri TaxID=208326 RepID=A0ABU7AH44_9TELE|nr:hypothetical protein [Ataeniobius toweri]